MRSSSVSPCFVLANVQSRLWLTAPHALRSVESSTRTGAHAASVWLKPVWASSHDCSRSGTSRPVIHLSVSVYVLSPTKVQSDVYAGSAKCARKRLIRIAAAVAIAKAATIGQNVKSRMRSSVHLRRRHTVFRPMKMSRSVVRESTAVAKSSRTSPSAPVHSRSEKRNGPPAMLPSVSMKASAIQKSTAAGVSSHTPQIAWIRVSKLHSFASPSS